MLHLRWLVAFCESECEHSSRMSVWTGPWAKQNFLFAIWNQNKIIIVFFSLQLETNVIITFMAVYHAGILLTKAIPCVKKKFVKLKFGLSLDHYINLNFIIEPNRNQIGSNKLFLIHIWSLNPNRRDKIYWIRSRFNQTVWHPSIIGWIWSKITTFLPFWLNLSFSIF